MSMHCLQPSIPHLKAFFYNSDEAEGLNPAPLANGGGLGWTAHK